MRTAACWPHYRPTCIPCLITKASAAADIGVAGFQLTACFFRSLRSGTNSGIRLHVAAYPVKYAAERNMCMFVA